MKKSLSEMVEAVKDKFQQIISKFSKQKTTKNRWRKGVAAGRSMETKTPVLGAPGTPIKSSGAAQRRPYTPINTKQRKKGFDFMAFFANRKRFAMVVSVVAAAVLIPVIVSSANADADNTRAVDAQEVAERQMSEQENTVPLSNTPEQVDPAVQTEMQADAAQPEAAAEATPEPKKYLTLDPETNHSDVIKLQQRLMDLHYMDNDEPTDYYGPHTQKCVSYFQRKHNLPTDGVAGPATQDLLFSDEAQTYSVAMGSEGDDVSQMQYRLQELGYSVAVTGYFGSDTEDNLKYFQRMNDLDDDGSMGQYTKDILFSEQAEPAEEMKKKSSGSGSGKSSGGGGSSHTANPGSVEAFIDAALSQLGKPYRTAGKGPDSFDCSGFVYYALNASGNGIGYMTSGGWASSGYSTVGSFGDLQRGDIICFSGHVGIYLGGGEMVDASSSNGCVVRRGMGSWARNNFICGKRPL